MKPIFIVSALIDLVLVGFYAARHEWAAVGLMACMGALMAMSAVEKK